jgi:hypothetical protein
MLFDIEEKQIKHKDVTNKTKDSLFWNYYQTMTTTKNWY